MLNRSETQRKRPHFPRSARPAPKPCSDAKDRGWEAVSSGDQEHLSEGSDMPVTPGDAQLSDLPPSFYTTSTDLHAPGKVKKEQAAKQRALAMGHPGCSSKNVNGTGGAGWGQASPVSLHIV